MNFNILVRSGLVSYPSKRGKCDLVLSGQGFKPEFGLAAYEWAIENKYVRFIGDNGKNNDYGVTKVVSSRIEKIQVVF